MRGARPRARDGRRAGTVRPRVSKGGGGGGGGGGSSSRQRLGFLFVAARGCVPSGKAGGVYQMAHLYLMAKSDDPGVLKIGRSDEPARRAKDLEKSQAFHVTAVAVFAGAGDLEREIHSKLEACRKLDCPGKEWFRTPLVAALRAVGDAMDAVAAPTTQHPPPPLSSASYSSSSSSEAMDVAEGPVVSSQHASIMRKELESGVNARGNPLSPAIARMHMEKLSKRAAQLTPWGQRREMARLDAFMDKWAAPRETPAPVRSISTIR